MSDPQPSHAPISHHPADDVVALGIGARLFDVVAGTHVLADDWVAAHAARENRSVEECREELINAIARGDLRVEDAGSGAEGPVGV